MSLHVSSRLPLVLLFKVPFYKSTVWHMKEMCCMVCWLQGISLGFLVTKEWRGMGKIPSDVEGADSEPEVVLHFCG